MGDGITPTLTVFMAAFAVVVGVWVVTRLIKVVWTWTKYAAILTAASLGLCELTADHGVATCLDAFIDALPMTAQPQSQSIDNPTTTPGTPPDQPVNEYYSFETDWLHQLLEAIFGDVVNELGIALNSLTVFAFLYSFIVGAILITVIYAAIEASNRVGAVFAVITSVGLFFLQLFLEAQLQMVMDIPPEVSESMMILGGIGFIAGSLFMLVGFEPRTSHITTETEV